MRYKSDEERKDQIITLKVTNQQKIIWQNLAFKNGITLSRFIELCIQKALDERLKTA